jgi:1-acyl-sn-glycerol-3-phosphate acyltransferase
MKSYQTIKEKRAAEFEKNPYIKGIPASNVWHKVLLPLLKVNDKINHLNLHIINDKRRTTNKPVIYACTHIGFYDVMMLFEAITCPCWLFCGDPDSLINTFYGWMLEKNGVIWVDNYDKADRKLAKEIATQLLKQGGNLMIFPEGAWNMTDNLIVMKLYQGTAMMALETDADIVPIAIEQYGKEFYVNIGENISSKDCGSDVLAFTERLRDILATLKWEIWELFPLTERGSLPENMKNSFAADILAESGDDSYTMKMYEDERYHDKNITSPEEAFAFIKNLIPRRENAFLFRGLENAGMEENMGDRKTEWSK